MLIFRLFLLWFVVVVVSYVTRTWHRFPKSCVSLGPVLLSLDRGSKNNHLKHRV